MAAFDIYGDLCESTSDRTGKNATLPAQRGAQPQNLAELAKGPLHSPAETSTLRRSFSTEETPALETSGKQADGVHSKNGHKNDVQEWSAPGWDAWNFNDGFAVEAGEIVKSTSPPPEKPVDFEALQKELLADEQSAVLCRVDAKATEVTNVDSASGSDTEAESEAAGGAKEDAGGPLIQLDEIRASERQPLIVEAWSRGPRSRAASTAASGTDSVNGGASRRLRRKEVSLFMGPPPPVLHTSSAGNPAERLVLVGGVPWWFSDAELRRQAEQFGQLRSIRILESERSGKSVGIALLEYTTMEAAQRAANPAEGFCTLSIWVILEQSKLVEAKPRAVLVSQELFGKLRSGTLPWPDGGSCGEDLRAILLRQFDMSHNSALIRSNNRPAGGSPLHGLQRRNSHASGGGASPDVDRPRREEDWAEKLKKLKTNVNRRQMEPVDGLTDGVLRKRRR